MELRLENGDYVPDGLGGFVRESGDDALLARALFLLTARRGALVFLPELGSRLWQVASEKPAGREMAAVQYAQEALDALGVQVAGAAVEVGENQTARVAFSLRVGGETRTAEVTV